MTVAKKRPNGETLIISIVPCFLFLQCFVLFSSFINILPNILMLFSSSVLLNLHIIWFKPYSLFPLFHLNFASMFFLQNPCRSLRPFFSLSPTFRFVPRSFWPRCSPWSKIDQCQYKKKRTSNAYPGKGREWKMGIYTHLHSIGGQTFVNPVQLHICILARSYRIAFIFICLDASRWMCGRGQAVCNWIKYVGQLFWGHVAMPRLSGAFWDREKSHCCKHPWRPRQSAPMVNWSRFSCGLGNQLQPSCSHQLTMKQSQYVLTILHVYPARGLAHAYEFGACFWNSWVNLEYDCITLNIASVLGCPHIWAIGFVQRCQTRFHAAYCLGIWRTWNSRDPPCNPSYTSSGDPWVCGDWVPSGWTNASSGALARSG